MTIVPGGAFGGGLGVVGSPGFFGEVTIGGGSFGGWAEAVSPAHAASSNGGRTVRMASPLVSVPQLAPGLPGVFGSQPSIPDPIGRPQRGVAVFLAGRGGRRTRTADL